MRTKGPSPLHALSDAHADNLKLRFRNSTARLRRRAAISLFRRRFLGHVRGAILVLVLLAAVVVALVLPNLGATGASTEFVMSAPYRNCAEARANGDAPIRQGQPGYGLHLDRDRDGVACELYRGQ